MTIVIFIVILAALIFVHELGHFVLAKLFGIRVDEFALGFPPKIISKKIGGTIYSLNLIPFGGFVKIFGEDALDVLPDSPDRAKSFTSKNRAIQGAVLLGGIVMNIIFAWILITVVFMTGAPVSAEDYANTNLENKRILVLGVAEDSPAKMADIKIGDSIRALSLKDIEGQISVSTVNDVQNFIASNENKTLVVSLERGEKMLTVEVKPKQGIVEGRAGIGVSLDEVGTLKLSLPSAIFEGGKRTFELLQMVAVALAEFIYKAFTFTANFNEVSGPVGIAAMVGNARELGWFYLLSFTALISLNLAVINIIPFPALDGGRLLFVIIESVIRRPLSPKFTKTANTVGFALLILLLVLVTYKDLIQFV